MNDEPVAVRPTNTTPTPGAPRRGGLGLCRLRPIADRGAVGGKSGGCAEVGIPGPLVRSRRPSAGAVSPSRPTWRASPRRWGRARWLSLLATHGTWSHTSQPAVASARRVLEEVGRAMGAFRTRATRRKKPRPHPTLAPPGSGLRSPPPSRRQPLFPRLGFLEGGASTARLGGTKGGIYCVRGNRRRQGPGDPAFPRS